MTIAGQTFTVTQAVAAPVCTLSANPASITSGGSSTLTATCSPPATSYIWTGGTCTVKPTATTIYSVQGSNASGTNQAASATVTVAATNVPSYTVPGTLGGDVFVLTPMPRSSRSPAVPLCRYWGLRSSSFNWVPTCWRAIRQRF